MGTIEEYRDGRVLKGIEKALAVLGAMEGSPAGSAGAERITEKIREFEPLLVSVGQAVAVVRKASRIAVGERVCRRLHPGSELTESLFLDALASAMVETGHAVPVEIGEAEKILESYRGHPLVMSKVSGSYLEICASSSSTCVFRQAERKGIRCLKRAQL